MWSCRLVLPQSIPYEITGFENITMSSVLASSSGGISSAESSTIEPSAISFGAPS